MAGSPYNQFLRELQAHVHEPCAVLAYADVRDMRALNRIASPREGDTIIAAVQRKMQQWCGGQGRCTHLWSNEFVAVRAIDHPQSALEEVARLRDELASVVYRSPLGDNRISVAIGLAVVRRGSDWARVINEASEACQAAKRRGVNQMLSHVPHDSIHAPARHDIARVHEFRELMLAGRLNMHPQPIMDITRAVPRLAKAEFLLRVENEDRATPLPPGTIETLEYHGLTAELDGFGTQSVLAWLGENPIVAERLDSISMNLSARSILDGRFMDSLYREIRHARVPAQKLCFEITETAAIEHLEVAAEVIGEFRRMGCKFSLDDFGSGLCSFGYLHSLPVDEVKIDGRFIRDLKSSAVSQEIVRAIHQVARATGKKTVAEFVDEAGKLEALQRIGVDYAQGWLFYPAVSPRKFLELLKTPERKAA